LHNYVKGVNWGFAGAPRAAWCMAHKYGVDGHDRYWIRIGN
jgi:hypothetical protein